MNYYIEKYQSLNPYNFELLSSCETKGERKSIKERIIKDVKMQEYPKAQTKKIIDYVKSL